MGFIVFNCSRSMETPMEKAIRLISASRSTALTMSGGRSFMTSRATWVITLSIFLTASEALSGDMTPLALCPALPAVFSTTLSFALSPPSNFSVDLI